MILLNLLLLLLFLSPLCLVKVKPIGRFYGHLFGQLWSNNNARAAALFVFAVIITVEALAVFATRGVPESPLVSGVRELKLQDQQMTNGHLLEKLTGGVSAAFVNEKIAQEPTPSKPSWKWVFVPFLAWLAALVYLPLAFRDEAMTALLLLASLFKRSRPVAGHAVSGQAPTPVGDATTEGRHDQTGRTDWKRWLSPAWWIEYMLDDVLSEWLLREGPGVMGKFFARKAR